MLAVMQLLGITNLVGLGNGAEQFISETGGVFRRVAIWAEDDKFVTAHPTDGITNCAPRI